MPRLSRFAVAVATLACLLLACVAAGCGGDGDSGGSSNEKEALRIEQFQADIRFFCSAGKNDLYGTSDPLGTLLNAVDNLIKIYKDDPEATYKLAKIAKTGDKLGQREAKIDALLKESAATLSKKCGRYGPPQAKRLEDAVNA